MVEHVNESHQFYTWWNESKAHNQMKFYIYILSLSWLVLASASQFQSFIDWPSSNHSIHLSGVSAIVYIFFNFLLYIHFSLVQCLGVLELFFFSFMVCAHAQNIVVISTFLSFFLSLYKCLCVYVEMSRNMKNQKSRFNSELAELLCSQMWSDKMDFFLLAQKQIHHLFKLLFSHWPIY